MNTRLRAYFQRIKAHRLGSTLAIVATLALGILIGTVAWVSRRWVARRQPPHVPAPDVHVG